MDEGQRVGASLAFVSVSFLLTELLFRRLPTKNTALWTSVAAIVALLAAQLAYEYNRAEPNFYQMHGVGRHSTASQIRKAFKEMSVKLHPDKNHAADATTRFDALKKANDVLMEMEKRDAYNKFGPDSLEFDPRQDELQLITSILMSYMGLAILTIFVTLSPQTRACRTWITFWCLGMLAIEGTLCLTEISLPSWLPKYTTEFELLSLLHVCFPAVLMILRAFAKYMYFDVEAFTLDMLAKVQEHNKAIVGVLHQAQVAVNEVMTGSQSASESTTSAKLAELQTLLKTSSSDSAKLIDTLRQKVARTEGGSLSWLIFVAMYFVFYYFSEPEPAK